MKTKKAGLWILIMALMVSLLAGCSGNKEPYETGGGRSGKKNNNSKTATSKMKMPFNGEVTFHDMHVTIPTSFIRDSTESDDDVWVFERGNYSAYIMLIRGALEMQGGMTTPENYSEIMRSGGAESEVTTFQGLPCVYTTSVANNGMYATEAVVFVNDTTYALTMCTKKEEDMEEYGSVYDSLSFDVNAGSAQAQNETLLVNQTAADILTAGAWVTPHWRFIDVPEQDNSYVYHAYDTLDLMYSIDHPGARSFMKTFNDSETGYAALKEAAIMQEEQNLRDGTVTGNSVATDETTLYRNDTRLLSFMIHHNTPFDAGSGRVGLWEDTLETHNVDAQTGRELALTDVVSDTEMLAEIAADLLIEACHRVEERSSFVNDPLKLIADEDGLRETVHHLLEDDGYVMNGNAFFAWSPSYLGLRMTFVTETLGIAYPSGYWTPPTIEITIPYSSAQDIFVKEWTELPENFIAPLAFNTEYRFDFGAGARTLRISPPAFTYDDEVDKFPCAVSVGAQAEQTLEAPGSDFYDAIGLPQGYLVAEPAAAYLVRNNGNHFLWVQYEIDSAIGYYPCLSVCEIENDMIRQQGFLHEGIMRITPTVCPELFYMGHEFKPFGGDAGSFGMCPCYVGEDGIPVPQNAAGYVFHGTGATYRTCMPLNLWLADATEPMTVPEGTLFTESATDGETWISFDTEYGIFYLNLGDYGQMEDVDGHSIWEAFEYVSGY